MFSVSTLSTLKYLQKKNTFWMILQKILHVLHFQSRYFFYLCSGCCVTMSKPNNQNLGIATWQRCTVCPKGPNQMTRRAAQQATRRLWWQQLLKVFFTKIQMIALWFLQSGSNNQSLSQCLQEGKLLVHGGHTFGKMKVLHIKFILPNFDSESDDFRLAKCLHCDKIVRRGKEGCSPRECTNSGMGSHMRSHHSGIAAQVLLFFEFTFCNLYCFQVQMQVQAAKATKVDTDLKDETVRGMMPLFKLRSKNDREQWRKIDQSLRKQDHQRWISTVDKLQMVWQMNRLMANG